MRNIAVTARHTVLVAAFMFALATAAASTGSAGQPASCLSWKYLTNNRCGITWLKGCGCADDYCPKAQPTVCNECRGTCDDYCPKPMPQTCPTKCGCCDDYCPKAWRPMTWCPPCVYRCLPGGCPAR